MIQIFKSTRWIAWNKNIYNHLLGYEKSKTPQITSAGLHSRNPLHAASAEEIE